MPSKNVTKIYASGQYYHLYNRGANKHTIFHDQYDYRYFLYILERHLSKEPHLDKNQRPYRQLHDDIEILAYCLMANHFHFLVYNNRSNGIELLMRSACTAYSMYYNKKYKHSGRLFQGAYKASLINSSQYLQHVARYIHRNPSNYLQYPYSSYQATIICHNTEWLSNKLIEEAFDGSPQEYIQFVADYTDFKETLEFVLAEVAEA